MEASGGYMKIFKTVGRNGANESSDVKVVQSGLNSHVGFKNSGLQKVKVDGRCGPKTIEAIGIFQKHYVGMATPDYRVDPQGKTIRYLGMYKAAEPKSSAVATFSAGVSASAIYGMDNYIVSYAADVHSDRRMVSPYAINIVKIALKEAGMTHAVITSTLRTPEDQAKIMLKNAKKNLASQKKLYADAGRRVLEVYENNKTKEDSEILSLMVQKINSYMGENIVVSNHCFSIKNYKAKNVFDIGLNSTKAKNKNFNKDKFTSALNDLVKEGYIKKFIDETGKTNQCWHLEIIPDVKAIKFFDNNSILFPIKAINGAIV